MSDAVRVVPIDGGAFWRVTFGGAKGNILDRTLMADLRRALARAKSTPQLKAVCIEGAGEHFSYGASVAEHLPDQVAAMLENLRHLVLEIIDSDVIVLAAVRGQCLGGGLELASVCHRVFAGTDAQLGQPEIALGVFAPIASIVLPARIGRARAEDLCLTGRTVTAGEALAMGLVDEVSTADPADAAIEWARLHFSARSASSLRLAVHAVRADLASRLRVELPVLEALYLKRLMATGDATEGVTAFLEKRPPIWRDA